MTCAPGGQSATFEPNGSTPPAEKGLKFEPEYAVEGGVAHTFNGTLYVPTPEEMERIDRLNGIREGVKKMVAEVAFDEPSGVQRAVPYVHGFTNDGDAPRVKMSAGEIIRLGATKSKGR